MALNQAQLVNPPVGVRPGGVKAGSGISIAADGTISATGGGVTSVTGSGGVTASPTTGAVVVSFDIANLPALP